MTETTAARPTFNHREILVVFSGVALAMLMAAMDQTIVATALPTIAAEFGGLDDMPWVVTAYLLASTATTPIYGKLSDIYGRKRVLQAAITLFLVGSLLCASATSMIGLIVFRGLQGLGGGGLMALAFTIIGDVVAPRERGRYQGYIGGMFALASVAGPLLGGVFTERLSWHWIFLINLPLGAAALAMTARALDRLPAARGRAHVDIAGAGLLFAAVTCLLLVVSRGGHSFAWTSPTALGLAAAGTVLSVLFLRRERHVAEPVLPMRVLRIPVVAVAAPVVALSSAVLFGGILFLPLLLHIVFGLGATAAGVMLLPLVFGMTLGAVGGGRMIARTGRYRLYPIVGLGLAAVMQGVLGVEPQLVGNSLASAAVLVPMGLGLGMVMPVMTVAVQNAVSQDDLGAATASMGFFRSLGGSVGAALFGAVLTADVTRRLAAAGVAGVDARDVIDRGSAAIAAMPADARQLALAAFEDGFGTLFMVSSAMAMLAFALTLFLQELPLRSAETPGAGTR
jgi:EmrB/QacA subfamily drug resistance transporter